MKFNAYGMTNEKRITHEDNIVLLLSKEKKEYYNESESSMALKFDFSEIKLFT